MVDETPHMGNLSIGGFESKTAISHRPTSAADIGNAHIEGKGICPPGGSKTATCFLDDTVRTELDHGITSRVNKAAVWWASALSKVRLEEALREPEDVSVFGDLVLDALTGMLGRTLTKAIKGLRGRPQTALAELGVDLLDIESGDKVKEADDGTTGVVVRAMTSAAKRGLKVVATVSDENDFVHDKEVAKDYFSYLADAAADAFDKLSLDALGMMGDADKILYFHAWAPTNGHKESDYVAEIKAKLAVYQASPASKIGRTTARKHLPEPTKDSSFEDKAEYLTQGDVRATKLVMQYYDNEQPPRLFYFKRDFDGAPARAPGGDQLLDTDNEYPESFAKDDGYVMYKEVEPTPSPMKNRTNRRGPHQMQTYVWILVTLALTACNEKGELREQVDRSCTLLAGDFDRAAKKYEEFAEWAKGRTPDETWERREIALPCRWRSDARSACAVQLASRLQACVAVKAGDAKKLEEVSSQMSVAFDRFTVGSDPQAAASAMRELATIASTILDMSTKN